MREGTVWKANRYTSNVTISYIFFFERYGSPLRRASNPLTSNIDSQDRGGEVDRSLLTRAAYKLKTGEEKRGGDTKKARRTHEEARKERSKCRVASLGLVITRWLLNK